MGKRRRPGSVLWEGDAAREVDQLVNHAVTVWIVQGGVEMAGRDRSILPTGIVDIPGPHRAVNALRQDASGAGFVEVARCGFDRGGSFGPVAGPQDAGPAVAAARHSGAGSVRN